MVFELPALEYEYDALEPWIDAKTMEFHHSKHHKTYTDKFNSFIEKYPELFKKSAEELIANLDSIPEDIRIGVRNHGGGYANHKFFFNLLRKDIKISGKIAEEINKTFENFEEFKKKFSEIALGVFGSGWAWLVVDKAGKLDIVKTSNQDSPLSSGLKPILTLDVWEHSYYLKFQNRRADYIDAWWNVINWKKVEELYKRALKTI